MIKSTNYLQAMTTTRQQLRRLIKDGIEINTRIDGEEYSPLLKQIADISKQNGSIISDENNSLILKTGITRVTNATFLNILESKKNLVFNEGELAEALLKLAQDEDEGEINWLKLSDQAMRCFKTVFLPFPVQVTHEPREEPTEKVRAKREKKSQGAPTTTVAEKLSRFEGENVRALESVYSDIRRSYIDGGSIPMPFYKLICDPTSFTKSVNNAFQLSFLIQSNLVRVFKNDAETLLDPIDINTPFTSQKGGDNSVHAVITLDYELWEATVSNYQIETSMICG